MSIKLSIIMPNFNMSKYFVEALESVFAQTFQDFEVIFLDDGSTDDSLSIIENYRKNHPNIKVIRNPKNLGVIATINIGIQHVKRKFVFFFAADDKIIDTTFFEQAIASLEKNPSHLFCTSDHGMFFDGSNGIDKTWRTFPQFQKITAINPSEFMTMCRKKQIAPCGLYLMGAIFRKETFIQEKFNDRFLVLSDWYLIHLTALKRGCLYLPSVCVIWRKRGKENLHNFRKKEESLNLLEHIAKNKGHKKLFQSSTLLKEVIRDARKQGQLTFRPHLWSFVITWNWYKLKSKFQRLQNFTDLSIR